MKISSIKKWLFEHMWLILFVLIFSLGVIFIIWMGNSDPKNGVKPEINIEPVIIDYNETPESSELDINLAMPTFFSKAPKESNSQDSKAPEEPNEQDINDLDEEDEDGNALCPTLLIKRGNKLMLFNKNIPETPGENPIFFDNLNQYKEYIKLQNDLYNKNCPILFLQEEENAQGENVYRLRQTTGTTKNVDPLMLSSVNDYFKNNTNIMPKFAPPKGPSAFNKPTPNSEINMINYGVPLNTMQQPNMQPMVPYVDANRSNAPFNQGYFGFDPSNQYVGKFTILDEIHNSTKTQNPDGLSDNPMDHNWGGAVFTEEQIVKGKYDENNVQPPTVTDVLKYDDYPSAFDGNSIPLVEKYNK